MELSPWRAGACRCGVTPRPAAVSCTASLFPRLVLIDPRAPRGALIAGPARGSQILTGRPEQWIRCPRHLARITDRLPVGADGGFRGGDPERCAAPAGGALVADSRPAPHAGARGLRPAGGALCPRLHQPDRGPSRSAALLLPAGRHQAGGPVRRRLHAALSG